MFAHLCEHISDTLHHGIELRVVWKGYTTPPQPRDQRLPVLEHEWDRLKIKNSTMGGNLSTRSQRERHQLGGPALTNPHAMV